MNGLHMSKRLFHGDLKPQNIFVEMDGDGFLTTDSGTLTPLYKTDDEPIYIIRVYTDGFSSKKHIAAVSSRESMTYN